MSLPMFMSSRSRPLPPAPGYANGHYASMDAPSIKMPMPDLNLNLGFNGNGNGYDRYSDYGSNVSRTPSERAPRPSSSNTNGNGSGYGEVPPPPPLAATPSLSETLLPEYPYGSSSGYTDVKKNPSISQFSSVSNGMPSSLYPGGSRTSIPLSTQVAAHVSD